MQSTGNYFDLNNISPHIHKASLESTIDKLQGDYILEILQCTFWKILEKSLNFENDSWNPWI